MALVTVNAGSAPRPIVVLDTCVLLADPQALFAFPEALVVLPLTVIEELDDHKQRPDEVGHAARQVLRSIEALRGSPHSSSDAFTSAIELPNGGFLRIEANGLRTDVVRNMGLDPQKPDNRILAAALGLGPDTTVCSADAAVRLKASYLGLAARDYQVDSAAGLFTTYETVGASSDTFDALFSDRKVPASSVLSESFPENTCLVLEAGSTSALVRKTGDSLRLVEPRQAWGLRPRSAEQRFALDLLCDPDVPIVALSGHAGTGKTIVALAAALEQVFEPSSARYDRLMVLRPVVSVGRQDLGFLPGDLADKLGPWFEAIVDTMVALGDDLSYKAARGILDQWLSEDRLTLGAVTYMRGRSLQNTFVIVDECQNLEPLVAKTILTRLGSGSKAVLLGDTSQIDSPWLSEKSNALATLVGACHDSPLFGHLHLTRGERSPVADLAARVL